MRVPAGKGGFGANQDRFSMLSLFFRRSTSASARLGSLVGRAGQADTNIALALAASPFWGVSDAIQTKRREVDHEPAYSALWMHLLLDILRLCADARFRPCSGPCSRMVPRLASISGTSACGRSRSRCSIRSRRTCVETRSRPHHHPTPSLTPTMGIR